MGQIGPIFFIIHYESSSTFTVPKGVKKIDVFCVGGGGGGGCGYCYRSPTDWSYFYGTGGGGGGGGYTTTVLNVDVTPGQQLSVVVGAGSIGAPDRVTIDGGYTSSVGDICSAKGGNGSDGTIAGSNGGSGGGTGGTGNGVSGLDGGYDGSDGGSNEFTKSGKGQGTTTRYFGESTGTLYAGGGGGGTTSGSAGVGGDGGGGNGGFGKWHDNGGWHYNTNAWEGSAGAANTGGGGGGGGADAGNGPEGAGGSGGSGICIIRWGKQ